MAELEVKFVHSNGRDNKNPAYDLGGTPSQFEIAIQPMNNLFDNITPEEAEAGLTNYRCLYIVNNTMTVVKNCNLSITSGGSGGTISLGTKKQDDWQKIIITGRPHEDGYAIFDTEFGGSKFTCTFTNDDWGSFVADFTTGIQSHPLCSAVDVTDTDRLDGGVEILVKFEGDAKNRKVKPIILVQNSLKSVYGGTNRVSDYEATDSYNGIGDIQLNVIWPMSNIPSDGMLHVFHPVEDTYQHISYTGFSSGTIFDLSTPLDKSLVVGDEVWFDLPEPEICQIRIVSEQEGWPINQNSSILEQDTDTPEDWELSEPFSVGTLRPKEGFFIWMKRVVSPGSSGGIGNFTLDFTGDDT